MDKSICLERQTFPGGGNKMSLETRIKREQAMLLSQVLGKAGTRVNGEVFCFIPAGSDQSAKPELLAVTSENQIVGSEQMLAAVLNWLASADQVLSGQGLIADSTTTDPGELRGIKL